MVTGKKFLDRGMMMNGIIFFVLLAAFAFLGAQSALAADCSGCTADTVQVVQPTGSFEISAGALIPIEVLIDPSTVGHTLDTTQPILVVYFDITQPSGRVGGFASSGQLVNVTPADMSQSQWRGSWNISQQSIDAGNVTAGTYAANITVFFRRDDGVLLTHPDFSNFVLTLPDTTAPTANAGPDQTVSEDTLVAFDGSASSDNVGITSFTWTFTDVTLQTLTGASPSYTFATPGVYLVTLTVADAAGNTATDTVTITVNDITPPSVGVLYPPQVFVDVELGLGRPSTMSVYATVTDNIGLSSVIVTLTSPSGSVTAQQTAVLASGRYSTGFSTNSSNFPELGTYVARFIATDTSANVNASETNTITFVSPIAVQNVTANPSTIEQGDITTISANVSTEPSDLLDNVLANFTSPSGAVTQQIMIGVSSVGFSTDFATDSTTEIGVWTVVVASSTSLETGRLAAINNTESTTFEVVPAPDTTVPTANAGPDQTVNEDTLVTFDGSGSTDSVGITSYTWTFTDGTAQTLTGVAPTYTFATPGVYLVTLTVADAAGNTATDTVTITVDDTTVPSVMIFSSPQMLFVGSADGAMVAAVVTDNVGLSSVIATLTSPSGAITAQQVVVPTPPFGYYLVSFSESTFPEFGTYVVRFIATDTSANINASETATITLVSPINVQNLSANPSTIEQGDITTISANVTNELNIDSVIANFTSPSGAVTQQMMVTGDGSIGTIFSTDFATDSTTEVGVWTVVVIAITDNSISDNRTESTTFIVTAAPPVINLTNQTNGTVMLNETNTTLNCDESTIANLSIVGANGIQVNNCILAGSPQLLVQNSVGSMNNLVVNTPGMSITLENGTLTLSNVAFGDGSGAQVLFPTATLTGDVAVNGSLLSVTPTSASLDSAAVPGLNTSATLTFPNVPFGNPRVVFNDGNGGPNQVCEAPRCQNFSFANGVVNFTVTQWSEYIVEETPGDDNNNNGNTGGGGGGGQPVV